MDRSEERASIGAVGVGVIMLALATAIIHIYLFLIEGFLGNGAMLPLFQFLFVGNFFAYVVLVAALYLPISSVARFRPVIRAFLIAIAFASILSYFRVGVFDTLGNIDKVVEVLLIVAATADAGMSGGESGGGRGAILQLVIGLAAGLGMFLFLSLFIG